MEIIKGITKRSSVRKFTSEPVSDEELKTILLAGDCAPVSMGRYETMQLTVVRDAGVLKRIGAGASIVMSKVFGKEMKSPFNFYGAKTLVVISSKESAIKGINFANGGTIAENMMLQAAEGGIGSCVIWFAAAAINADAELKKSLGISEDMNALFAVALGHSAIPVPEKTPDSMKIKCNYV
ncbi:MAG: nitroreductase family protein [Clostridia bacterium]|nr:nitroreductase family protein [Clostridia bacterium]